MASHLEHAIRYLNAQGRKRKTHGTSEASSSSEKQIKIEPIDDVMEVDVDDDDVIFLEDKKRDERREHRKRHDRGMVCLKQINLYTKAAKDGELQLVKKWLFGRVPIDAPGVGGWTAAMYAASDGRFDVCKYLLKKGANPDYQYKDEMGILKIAQIHKHKEFVKNLLGYFCKTETPSKSSESEQLSFCEACDVFIVESAITKHVSSKNHQSNDNNIEKSDIPPSNIGYRLMCASGWREGPIIRNSTALRFPIKIIWKKNIYTLKLEMEKLNKKAVVGPQDRETIRIENIPKPWEKKEEEEEMELVE